MIVSLAKADDLTGLLELEALGFDAAQRWSEQSWRAELVAADRLVLVSRGDERIEAVACFSVLGDTAELLRVIVHPAVRRRGWARRLLNAGKQWAQAAGAERMLLEVRHDNAAALEVYAVAGFAPIAQRRDYYGTGQHGVVMEARLPRHSISQDELVGWSA